MSGFTVNLKMPTDSQDIFTRVPCRPVWNIRHAKMMMKCCFTAIETVGTGAQDVHLDFHTAPELCPLKTVKAAFNRASPNC